MVQKVHEVMTAAPVTVSGRANLTEAARMMRDRDIGDLFVVDGGELRGVLTDRDIVVRAAAEARDLNGTTVDEVCSHDIVDISPDDDADKVIMLMRARAVRRVPVMDGRKLIGMVALGDMSVERDTGSTLSDISTAQPNR